MNFRILVLAAAAGLALPALAQQPPAKPAAKPAAAPVATVNGTAISEARLEYLMRQQVQRGAPDNEQTRAIVREDLINREVVAQAAAKAGTAKRREVQAQLEVTSQEVLVGAYLSEYLRQKPVTDGEVQQVAQGMAFLLNQTGNNVFMVCKLTGYPAAQQHACQIACQLSLALRARASKTKATNWNIVSCEFNAPTDTVPN